MPLSLAAVIGLGSLGSDHTALARQNGEAVRDEERVTAVDVLVQLINSQTLEPIQAPRSPEPGDLSVLLDGEPVPVVAVEPTSSRSAEPWRVVIYFDLPLTSSRTVRWASSLLAGRLRELLELGPVEIVVADPEPGRHLAASRDPELIDDMLSGIFLRTEGEDRLVRRREQFLIKHVAKPRAGARRAMSEKAVAAERRLIRASQDEMASWLIDNTGDTAGRVLFLVSDGFDLDPGRYYADAAVGAELALEAGSGAPARAEAASTPVSRDTETLARTLAAYGWTVVALSAPEKVRGAARFGIQWAPPKMLIPTVSLRSIAVWLDGNRSPKKADAYNELGLSLRAQGKLEEAEQAFRRSVYRYYDHPKTAERQAVALVNLGETLELQGKMLEARDAYRSAVAFDADLGDVYPFTAARLTDPLAPLALLAEASAGRVADESGSLKEILAALRDRIRVTYQIAGPPDGSLRELEVHSGNRAGVLAPGWSRSGTPATVGELRLRRLLGGQVDAGDLPVRVSCGDLQGDVGDASSVTLGVRFPPTADAELSAANPIRLTWGSRGPQTDVVAEHRLLSPETLAGGGLDQRGDLPSGHVWAGVVVEEVATGAWGGGICELE